MKTSRLPQAEEGAKIKNANKKALERTVRRATRFGVLFAMVAFLLVFYGLALKNTPESAAIDPATWNAGRIVDDSVFYNANTMTVAEIQRHLELYSAKCDTWGERKIGAGRSINGVAVNPNITRREYAALMRAAGRTDYHDAPYVCISGYYENPVTHKTNYDTNTVPEEGMISAAQIIYDAAHKYNINPQVLLVMLKKESYVWGDDWPLKNEYNTVMGYACPDTAPCDAQYFGFYNQVMKSAWQLDYYKSHIYSYGYFPYMVNKIYYSPNYSCGAKDVYLENIATTSLYIYTPYTPNDASLRNYPGEAPCGSYGNRNFYAYFTEWFGSTRAGDSEILKKLKEHEVPAGFGNVVNETSCAVSAFGTSYCYTKYEWGGVYGTKEGVYNMFNGIYSKYTDGSNSTMLGVPTSAEKAAAVSGARVQEFENGRIYWVGDGARVVFGGINAHYLASDVEGGPFGLPISTEKKDENGTYQEFENGRIYWNGKYQAWGMNNKVYEYWKSAGGVEKMGASIDGWECDEEGRCSQAFTNGSIVYWSNDKDPIAVHGGILERYKAIGAAKSILGLPIDKEKKDSNGTYREFEHGRIYWNGDYGTWAMLTKVYEYWNALGGIKNGKAQDWSCDKNGVCTQSLNNATAYWSSKITPYYVHGGIGATYYAMKAEKSELGLPISTEKKDENGTYQEFENGRIYWHDNYGTWAMLTKVYDYWQKAGGRAKLGVAKSNWSCDKSGNCSQEFTSSTIYWSDKIAPISVHGGIRDRYISVGGMKSLLGLPIDVEKKDANGIYREFEHGRIYWSNQYGAWGIANEEIEVWLSLGNLLNFIPSTNIWQCGNDERCWHSYKNGRIFWKTGETAYAAWGAILQKYLELGAENGSLGAPTSSEKSDGAGNRVQDFENGKIYWNSKRGSWVVTTP